jgi:cyclopropane-fatty-acyl-phospholipid synthase
MQENHINQLCVKESMSAKSEVQRLLKTADVLINGKRAWDIQVRDERFYARVLAHGSLGFGDSYVDGWWDCKRLDEMFFRIRRAHLEDVVYRRPSMLVPYLHAKLTNMQRKSRAFEVGEKHYDIGNDLYSSMLDKRLTYTCGYWRDAKTLDEAQEAKLDLVCRKLQLKPGMTVLDIGCGWGSFAKFAAERWGVSVVGVTVSKEQVALARELCKGLPVKILLQDYRDIHGQFDRIVSLGMIEHVGFKNYKTYMRVCHRCLKDDGLFLLHTIGSDVAETVGDPWITKHIFPNSIVPSIKQLSSAIEGLFIMEDWHNFSADYDPTLMAWHKNFRAAWPTLRKCYGDRFYRMWSYYLLACAGSFRARRAQLWQIVLTKHGIVGGYPSIR